MFVVCVCVCVFVWCVCEHTHIVIGYKGKGFVRKHSTCDNSRQEWGDVCAFNVCVYIPHACTHIASFISHILHTHTRTHAHTHMHTHQSHKFKLPGALSITRGFQRSVTGATCRCIM